MSPDWYKPENLLVDSVSFTFAAEDQTLWPEGQARLID